MKRISESKPGDRNESLFLIDGDDLFLDRSEKKGTSLFLGKFTESVILEILDRNGFFKIVRKKGLWPLEYELDSSAFPPLQKLLVFHKTKKFENLIMDLRIKEGTFRVKSDLATTFPSSKYSFLVLDWLTVQNPLHRFSRKKPPLPGQAYPGLSLGRRTIDMFADLGKLNHNNGLIAFPAFFHVSLVFFPRCRFVNPCKMGEVLAIWKQFRRLGFNKLAWIIHLGCLMKGDGTAYKWESEEQIHPMCPELKEYIYSRSYMKKVKEAMKGCSYTIDWVRFNIKFEEELARMEKSISNSSL